MINALVSLAAFAAGWLLYTLVEYAVHRWGGHSAFWTRGHRAHLVHHTNPRYFPGTHQQTAILFFPVGAGAYLLFGGVAAAALVVGGAFGWGLFEYVHRGLHNRQRAPRTAYGRWVCLHHLHHHFCDARTNHGITSPLWDMVFRTYTPVTEVVIRSRNAIIPPWITNEALPPRMRQRFRLEA